MDKKHFLSLLYLLGVAPIIYAVSLSLAEEISVLIVFGLLNTIVLLIFSLLFSNLPRQKKTVWFAIIGGILLLGVVIGWFYKMWAGISNRLYDQTLAPIIDEITTPESGDNTTTSGTNAIFSGDESIDWDDWALEEEGEPEEEIQGLDEEASKEDWTASETSPKYTTVLPDQGVLNYAQVIPYLIDTYNLTKRGANDFTFASIATNNVLYVPFNIAASYSMIGTTINPSGKVSCNTYLVLKGIAQDREVSYTWAPQGAYRQKALELGQVNGCEDGAFVTKATL